MTLNVATIPAMSIFHSEKKVEYRHKRRDLMSSAEEEEQTSGANLLQLLLRKPSMRKNLLDSGPLRACGLVLKLLQQTVTHHAFLSDSSIVEETAALF